MSLQTVYNFLQNWTWYISRRKHGQNDAPASTSLICIMALTLFRSSRGVDHIPCRLKLRALIHWSFYHKQKNNSFKLDIEFFVNWYLSLGIYVRNYYQKTFEKVLIYVDIED